jgi:predicted Zn-ribbon and HTH transcriptional regulator
MKLVVTDRITDRRHETIPDKAFTAGPPITGMHEAKSTTREQITERLRSGPATAGALAREFDVTAAVAVDHVRHVARSLEPSDEQLLVAPPECRDCRFSAFDDPVNRPSRCPECKSESVREPAFRIE